VFGAGDFHLRTEDRPAPPALRAGDRLALGLTGINADSAAMLAEYPHGTWREIAEFPASTLVPLDGLDDVPAERLAALGKFAVPFGGLRRGRLTAGETVAVNGASGSFGSAAVLAALAIGASKVVALGRRGAPLEQLVALGRGRVMSVMLSGDVDRDAAAIRAVSVAGVDLAFDMVGRARPMQTRRSRRSRACAAADASC
jgi:alcohol dehydrogenase